MISILCAQLTHDLLAIAKFLLDCIASRASVALRVLHMATWKPHVGLCDIQLIHFSHESVDQQSDAT